MPRDAVSRTAHVGTVGKNGLKEILHNVSASVYTVTDSVAATDQGTINLSARSKISR